MGLNGCDHWSFLRPRAGIPASQCHSVTGSIFMQGHLFSGGGWQVLRNTFIELVEDGSPANAGQLPLQRITMGSRRLNERVYGGT